MPKRSSTLKTPKGPDQLAAFIVTQSTREDAPAATPEPAREKNAAAVALGRLGGLKGGKARANSLPASKRSEIAKKAALTRWKSVKE